MWWFNFDPHPCGKRGNDPQVSDLGRLKGCFQQLREVTRDVGQLSALGGGKWVGRSWGGRGWGMEDEGGMGGDGKLNGDETTVGINRR